MTSRFPLVLVLFASSLAACGSEASVSGPVTPEAEEPERTEPVVEPKVACARPRTAPVIAIEGVSPRRYAVSPCGDLAFRRGDGSVALRTSDGVLVELAAKGDVGAFDPTGTSVSYAREASPGGAPRVGVLRDLATGDETETRGVAEFGLDPATGKALPFVRDVDGIHVLRDGAFGPAIAGTADVMNHVEWASRLGPTVVGTRPDGALVLVDLARGVATAAPGIEFRSDGTRADQVLVGDAGHVVFYQQATQRPAGDTYELVASGVDVLDAATGARAGRLDVRLPAKGNLVERGKAIVVKGAGLSMDAVTGKHVALGDASLLAAHVDGTLVLQRVSAAGSTTFFAAAGDATETPWFTSARATEVHARRWGQDAVVLEKTRWIDVAGSESRWGGSEYGEPVLRRGAHEVARAPHAFIGLGEPAFAADGSAVFVGTRYASAPPAEAEEFGSLLTTSLCRLGADGTFEEIAADVPYGATLTEVGEGVVALAMRGDQGGPSRVVVYDVAAHTSRTVAEAEALFVTQAPWLDPTGVLVLEGRTTPDDRVTIWHGRD